MIADTKKSEVALSMRKPESKEELGALQSIFEECYTGLLPNLEMFRRENDETLLLIYENEAAKGKGDIIGGTTYVIHMGGGERCLTHRAIAIRPRPEYKNAIHEVYHRLLFAPLNNSDYCIETIRILGYPKELRSMFEGYGFSLENGSSFILREKLQIMVPAVSNLQHLKG